MNKRSFFIILILSLLASKSSSLVISKSTRQNSPTIKHKRSKISRNNIFQNFQQRSLEKKEEGKIPMTTWYIVIGVVCLILLSVGLYFCCRETRDTEHKYQDANYAYSGNQDLVNGNYGINYNALPTRRLRVGERKDILQNPRVQGRKLGMRFRQLFDKRNFGWLRSFGNPRSRITKNKLFRVINEGTQHIMHKTIPRGLLDKEYPRMVRFSERKVREGFFNGKRIRLSRMLTFANEYSRRYYKVDLKKHKGLVMMGVARVLGYIPRIMNKHH